MKIHADRGICEGHGMCESLMPEVFRVGDDGKITLLIASVPEGAFDDVALAVESCPVQALSLQEDE